MNEIRILCVDDERNVLRALERVFFDNNYEIFTALSSEEGLEILKNTEPIQIVISDYRMPEMNGVDFLREVNNHWPYTVRIVLSGYADTAFVVSAINEGQIYKFIPKPWNDDDLRFTISNAVERYYLNKKNVQLTEELKKKNHLLEKMNNNLETLVDERTLQLNFQNEVLKRAQNILDTLPVAIVGIDLEGLIVQCNQKSIEILNQKNIIGLDRRDILPSGINSFVEKVIKSNASSCQMVIDNAIVHIKAGLIKYSNSQEGVILVFDEVLNG